MSTSTSQYPSIAIVGAGPGGLLLARYLKLHSITCTVYERDISRDVRAQGGSLDLDDDAGLFAIKLVGLYDQFQQFARPEDGELKIMDKHANVLFADEGDGSSPEIDRTELRDILIDSVDSNTIQWNQQLLSVEPVDDGKGYYLHFSDGPKVFADVVIGADGTWSRIRPLLTPTRPLYSGIYSVALSITSIDERFPHLAHLVGRGFALITSDAKGLLPQRSSKGLVTVYVSMRLSEEWIKAHPLPSEPSAIRSFLLEQFEGWDDSLLDFIRLSDDSPIADRKIYAVPPDQLAWETNLSGITLLGDAAHVMSPYAGAGVNNALLDALELGKALTAALSKHKGSSKRSDLVMKEVDAGLRKYERKMWARAKQVGEESAGNLEALFSLDGPQAMVHRFKWFGGPVGRLYWFMKDSWLVLQKGFW